MQAQDHPQPSPKGAIGVNIKTLFWQRLKKVMIVEDNKFTRVTYNLTLRCNFVEGCKIKGVGPNDKQF
jgi:hypothetical protein